MYLIFPSFIGEREGKGIVGVDQEQDQDESFLIYPEFNFAFNLLEMEEEEIQAYYHAHTHTQTNTSANGSNGVANGNVISGGDVYNFQEEFPLKSLQTIIFTCQKELQAIAKKISQEKAATSTVTNNNSATIDHNEYKILVPLTNFQIFFNNLEEIQKILTNGVRSYLLCVYPLSDRTVPASLSLSLSISI